MLSTPAYNAIKARVPGRNGSILIHREASVVGTHRSDKQIRHSLHKTYTPFSPPPFSLCLQMFPKQPALPTLHAPNLGPLRQEKARPGPTGPGGRKKTITLKISLSRKRGQMVVPGLEASPAGIRQWNTRRLSTFWPGTRAADTVGRVGCPAHATLPRLGTAKLRLSLAN